MCKHRDKYNIYQKFSTQSRDVVDISTLCWEFSISVSEFKNKTKEFITYSTFTYIHF